MALGPIHDLRREVALETNTRLPGWESINTHRPAQDQWRQAALEATTSLPGWESINDQPDTTTTDYAAADAAVEFIVDRYVRPLVRALEDSGLLEQADPYLIQRVKEAHDLL